MILQERSALTQTRIGSINDPESCREAARLIKEGYPVGAFVRTTCVIWIDADNPQAVESIVRIKGAKRTGKPLSTVLPADSLVEIIDFDKIQPDLRPIFQDADELASRLGMICLFRVPITEEAVRSLPEAVVSETPDGTRWVQNFVPGKRRSDFPLVDRIFEAGVRVPSATSMNVSGQPEIVDQQEALAFCSEHGIPLFLADPGAKPVVKGSFPIISVGLEGVKLVREGHFPAYLFEYLLQHSQARVPAAERQGGMTIHVDTSQAQPTNYPIYKTHCERCASRLEPYELHDEIIEMLEWD